MSEVSSPRDNKREHLARAGGLAAAAAPTNAADSVSRRLRLPIQAPELRQRERGVHACVLAESSPDGA